MEWISVEERLPEAYKRVLVYILNASGEAGYDITFYCDHLYDTGDGWYLPANITHWMPLPEPPKEADNTYFLTPEAAVEAWNRRVKNE